MAPEEWFLLQDGAQRGPLTREQLAASLLQRSRGAMVWRQGLAGWARPEDLGGLLRAPAPPPPSERPDFEAAFEALARSYGAEMRVEEDERVFETTRAGVTARVACEVGDARASLAMTVGGTAYPQLSAHLEGELERLGKRLRLSREVQTGDADFDGKVYLDSPLPPAAVNEIASSPAFRRGVRSLLDQRFPAVQLDDEGLSVERSVERAAELERPVLDASLDALAEVAKSLGGTDLAWSRHRASTWPGWLMAGSALAGLVSVPVAWLAHALCEPVNVGHTLLAFLAGGAVWAAVMVLLVLMLRGRSDAMFHLAVSGSLLLVALASWTAAGLLGFNGFFDRAPRIERVVVVTSKGTETTRRVRLSRFSRRYNHRQYVTVALGPFPRRIRVSDETYDSVERGSSITVTSGAGALGWEWDLRAR